MDGTFKELAPGHAVGSRLNRFVGEKTTNTQIYWFTFPNFLQIKAKFIVDMKILLAAIATSVCALSCTLNSAEYNLKSANSNPSVAIPLITGSMGLVDAFNEKDLIYLKTYQDGLLYLNYDQQFISQDVRNLVDLPPLSTSRSFQVPSGNYPPIESDINLLSVNFPINMASSPEKLTEINFKSGIIGFVISFSPPNPTFSFELDLSVPEFINASGQALNVRVSTGNTSIPLAGYTYTSTTSNQINLQVTLIAKARTVPITIDNNTNITIGLTLTNLDFRYIKGFFGDQTTSTPKQTIAISAFGNSLLSTKTTVSFKQPTITFTTVNDYGVPLQINFTTLQGEKKGRTIDLTTFPASPIDVNSPVVLGTWATTTVAVSNVTEVVNFAPTSLMYQVSGRINAGLTTGTNFMADTSKMRVKMHMEVPLYGNATNIVLADTTEINLSSLKETQIQQASLQANIINQIPLDANVQIYLTDKNYTVLDSLIAPNQNPLVKGSTVDQNGELKTPGTVTKNIEIESSKITKLFQSSKLIVVAQLNTSGGNGGSTDVKFKSQYKLNSSFALLAKLKLSTNF